MYFWQFTPNYYRHFSKDSVTEKDTEEVVKFLTNMEDILGTQKYFWGQNDKPGAADFLVWPWIERLEAMCTIRTGEDPRIIWKCFTKASY